MKRNHTFAKALIITLSVLGLAVSFGQSILPADSAAEVAAAIDGLDPDLEPDDIMV